VKKNCLTSPYPQESKGGPHPFTPCCEFSFVA